MRQQGTARFEFLDLRLITVSRALEVTGLDKLLVVVSLDAGELCAKLSEFVVDGVDLVVVRSRQQVRQVVTTKTGTDHGEDKIIDAMCAH